uniref:Uncharacterized protein n=1 Tax=Salvator merianae TaxID=96440 RepID=A0A8D0ASV7_SALMN
VCCYSPDPILPAMSSGHRGGFLPPYHDPCHARCPPSTVCIQPPPFVVNIPGPALYCPDQPMAIEQCNPCAIRYGGGFRALNADVGSNLSSFCYQPSFGNSCN